MDLITEWILRRFVRDYGNTSDPNVRTKYGYLEAWVSIAGNIVIAAINLLLGFSLNSIALIAQSLHTASDVLTSVVVLIGFSAAARPPDERHPYGHGRVESVATLVIAVLLMVVGFEFAGKSIDRVIHGAEVKGNSAVVLVLLLIGSAKEWMARFAIGLGRAIGSPALQADAWHHRSDAIASALVAVSIASASAGYPSADSFLGILVSALILYTGAKLALSSASSLMGENADPGLASRITEVVRSVNGVRGMHGLSVHDYGGVKIASLHIQVDPELNVSESHMIAAAVKYTVLGTASVECVVHVEPDSESGGQLAPLDH